MKIVELLITVICAAAASGGFWSFLEKRHAKNDDLRALIIGIAHDRIISLGMFYLDRGFITPDEYENLYQYIYIPYQQLGGNGSAVRLMERVKNLPVKNL